MPNPVPEFEQKVLQTLWFFLAIVFSGVALFLPIVYVAIPASASPEVGVEAGSFALPRLAALVAIVCSVLAWIIPPRLASATRSRITEGSWREDPSELSDSSIPVPQTEHQYLTASFITYTMTQAVLFAVPAFLACVVFMAHRERWLLVVATLMLAAIATRFPTRSRLDRWVTAQESLVPPALEPHP